MGILVWSSMSFVESPTGNYLEKLVQLCSSMQKNKERKHSEESLKKPICTIQVKHHKMFSYLKERTT